MAHSMDDAIVAMESEQDLVQVSAVARLIAKEQSMGYEVGQLHQPAGVRFNEERTSGKFTH
jgi:hypothetical protein